MSHGCACLAGRSACSGSKRRHRQDGTTTLRVLRLAGRAVLAVLFLTLLVLALCVRLVMPDTD